jgi:hypothetical protein
LVRRGFDAYQRRDAQAMCDVAHALEPWEEWRLEVGEVRPVGERVLARTMVTARGQGSSVELTADSGVVFEFQDGRIMRLWSS